ncbi:MAG: hypothetical protein JJU29_20895 [Verrucomicrobia bacterium]|nr:hypothetical protein [Verrucomicrobiota bacterium]MCH8513074.1 hypothetical protein [Kiritimatiellia bacterium]
MGQVKSSQLKSNLAHGVISVLTALFLHALWLMMPLSKPQRPATSPTRTVLNFQPESTGFLWSPTLFSLPTSMGFSGARDRQSQTVAMPPLESPLDLAMSLDLAPANLLPSPTLPMQSMQPRFAPLTPAAEEFPPESRSGPYRWRLSFTSDEAPELQVFRPPRIPLSPVTLNITGVMHFDEYGQVSHLLVDPPGPPPPLRQELLQSLRLARIQRGLGPVRARFQLNLQPEEVR